MTFLPAGGVFASGSVTWIPDGGLVGGASTVVCAAFELAAEVVDDLSSLLPHAVTPSARATPIGSNQLFAFMIEFCFLGSDQPTAGARFASCSAWWRAAAWSRAVAWRSTSSLRWSRQNCSLDRNGLVASFWKTGITYSANSSSERLRAVCRAHSWPISR